MMSMNDEFGEIWQEQPTTGLVISVEALRQRASRLNKRLTWLRRASVLTWIGIGIGALANLLFSQKQMTPWFDAAQIVFYVLIIICSPWIFQKQLRNTETKVSNLNTLAASTPCFEFYRRQLEGRQADLKNGRRVAPFMIFAGVMLTLSGPQGPLPKILAGTIVAILSAAWYVRMRREEPRIQAELASLEASAPKIRS